MNLKNEIKAHYNTDFYCDSLNIKATFGSPSKSPEPTHKEYTKMKNINLLKCFKQI